MRRFLSFFCFFILISAVSFAEDTMKVEAEGFTIRVPLGWMAQYTKTPCVFMLYSPVEENDTFQENGNLVVEALPGKSSIKTYMEQSIAAIREMYKNPKVLEAKENYHVIAGQINETLVQQIQFFYIKGDNAYILTFSSTPTDFQRYVEVFKKTAKTFMY